MFFLVILTSEANAQVPVRPTSGLTKEIKLADLQTTSLKISERKLQEYNSTYYRVIEYTIFNNGQKAVCLADVNVQGYLTNTDPWDGNLIAPGCGSAVAVRTNTVCTMLNPRQSYTASFKCTDNEFTNFKYYVLWIDRENIILENDDNNNQKIVLIENLRTPRLLN